MRIKFYKFRAILVIYIIKLVTKLLFVESPPLVSVTALIKKGSQLLFVDLAYMNGLGFPGGIVKSDETLEEALKREVLEETGLVVENFKYFGSEKSHFRGHPTVSAIYIAETSGTIKHSDEGHALWLNPKEALNKMSYQDAEHVLEKFISSCS